jgi:hypothetical protein
MSEANPWELLTGDTMKRLFSLCLCMLLAQPALGQPAAEKVQKRLTELLAPGSATTASAFTERPVTWKGSKAVEQPVSPIQPYAGLPVRLPKAQGKEVRPHSVPEAQPLLSYREEPKTPQEIELPTSPLLRLTSLDVQTALPIPILAQPQKDRASLGDPAVEASLAAALAPFTPVRDRPIPFQALNLPDPFEHIRTGQLRNPPEENGMPPAIPLTKPTK